MAKFFRFHAVLIIFQRKCHYMIFLFRLHFICFLLLFRSIQLILTITDISGCYIVVWIAALYQALLTLEELLLCGTAFGEFTGDRSTTSSRSAPGLVIIPSFCFWHIAPTVTSTLYFILSYLFIFCVAFLRTKRTNQYSLELLLVDNKSV